MVTNTHIHMASKPRVSIVGVDGNVQALLNKVSEALRKHGQSAAAILMLQEAEKYADSFMAACAIALRYVEFC